MPATQDWYDWICRPQWQWSTSHCANWHHENVNRVEDHLKERLIERTGIALIIDRAMNQWRDRLRKCIRAKSGHWTSEQLDSFGFRLTVTLCLKTLSIRQHYLKLDMFVETRQKSAKLHCREFAIELIKDPFTIAPKRVACDVKHAGFKISELQCRPNL